MSVPTSFLKFAVQTLRADDFARRAAESAEISDLSFLCVPLRASAALRETIFSASNGPQITRKNADLLKGGLYLKLPML